MRTLERQAARRQTYALVGIGMIVVFGVVAIFMLLGATKRRSLRTYEDPAVALREVFAKQETLYHMKHGRYATLEELAKEGVVSEEVLAGPIMGFLYRATVVTGDHFEITAEPKGPPPPPDPKRPKRPEVPRRYYGIDESHSLRSDGAPITSSSPVIWSPRDAHGYR